MAKINHKHKTVGVSLCPLLRQSASRRARQQGMSFSRYVGLCVEAEVSGRVQLAAPDKAAQSGSQACAAGGEGVFTQGVDACLRRDVAGLLERAQVAFTRDTLLGAMRMDFSGQEASGNSPDDALVGAMQVDFLVGASAGSTRRAEGASLGEVGEGSNAQPLPPSESVAMPPLPVDGIVIECRYPSMQNHAALLGRVVMLQQFCHVGAILLCVPYLSLMDPVLHAVFIRQHITIVTPDTLLSALAGVGRRS